MFFIPTSSVAFSSVSLCSKWSGQRACSLRHFHYAVIHNILSHKARVYIGSSSISLTFLGQLGDLLGSTSPTDTGSSIQQMNFIRGLAFHAFRERIYSGWDQGGRGMRGGLLQPGHVKWCWGCKGRSNDMSFHSKSKPPCLWQWWAPDHELQNSARSGPFEVLAWSAALFK